MNVMVFVVYKDLIMYQQQLTKTNPQYWQNNGKFLAGMCQQTDVKEWLKSVEEKHQLLEQIKYYRTWLQKDRQELADRIKKKFRVKKVDYSLDQLEWLVGELEKEIDEGVKLICDVKKLRRALDLSPDDMLFMLNRKFKLNLTADRWQDAIDCQTNISHWRWIYQELKEMSEV